MTFTFALATDNSYLQNVDLSGGTVDIELAVGRVIRIDSLARQEVNDALLAIFVTIRGSDLPGKINLVIGSNNCYLE